jgi:hypothetical protein
VFSSAVIVDCLEKDFTLVHNYLFFDVWIFFVLYLKVVGWEGLDGKIGGADGSIFCDDVGSLSYCSCGDEVDVLFVDFSHERYDMFIGVRIKNRVTHHSIK